MTLAYVLIFGTIALLSITVILLFAWAIRTGQFADFERGATSIFDDSEPLGEMTDWFPDSDRSRTNAAETVYRDLPETTNKTDVDHA